MSTTRSVRPTDLVALVSLDGRVYPNEARTWERLGRRPEGLRPLDSALVPWFSFATGRHTWISVQAQSIGGLVSARQRGNRSAWEIECLIVATDDDAAIGNLFDQVTTGAGAAGVLKIFLRLEAGSDLIAPARRAGFVPYAEESLMRADGLVPPATLPAGYGSQAYQAADAFALYRLYNAAVPETIRRVEAPTFQQWLAMAEKRTSGRSRSDYVVRRNDEVVARVRACREHDLARIDIEAHPAAAAAFPAFIDLASPCTGSRRPLFTLIPAHAAPLGTSLLQAGFVLDSEYVALVKRTAIPLAASMPSKARVPVSQPLTAV